MCPREGSHRFNLDRHLRYREAGGIRRARPGLRQCDRRKDPARMREQRHAHGVGRRLPLISKLSEATGEAAISTQHQVVDPHFELRAGLARHPTRQIGCQGIAGKRRGDGFVEEFVRSRPTLPLEDWWRFQLSDRSHGLLPPSVRVQTRLLWPRRAFAKLCPITPARAQGPRAAAPGRRAQLSIGRPRGPSKSSLRSIPARSRPDASSSTEAGRIESCWRRRARAKDRAETPARSASRAARARARRFPTESRDRSSAQGRAPRERLNIAGRCPRVRGRADGRGARALAMYRPSSSFTVAIDAAQATGLPPKVDAWLPLGQSITEARATIAPKGKPLAIPLARQTMSPATPQCSEANILPVRPIPLCTSSKTSKTPCSSQRRRRPGKNSGGGTMYPPSPWIGSTKIAASSSGGQIVRSRPRTLSRSP